MDWVPSSVRWTESINEVISSDADVFVELVGGIKPAGEWIRKALRAGKSVVTANKLLIAHSGPELMDLAREKGKRLEFGASVAGGIPAIIGIQEGLAGDQLYKIAGVLNGTCNFILTKMEATGASFEAALKEAQELGFAEANPQDESFGSSGCPCGQPEIAKTAAASICAGRAGAVVAQDAADVRLPGDLRPGEDCADPAR